MYLSPVSFLLITYILALLGMAFFTLLERKVLGYMQIRKGPNKVGIAGLPQPLADAMKLFMKELSKPSLANISSFVGAPMAGLFLALFLWSLYPSYSPSYFIAFGTLFFLSVSSLNVYTTLIAGWSSNSKYALLGALRSIAQTISYEVSMALVLLGVLIPLMTLNCLSMFSVNMTPGLLLIPPLFLIWFTTALAETNRTPFDFAEGESELVSGFNTEYSSGTFALIFMAEYLNIIMMSLLSAVFFMSSPEFGLIASLSLALKTFIVAFAFLWVRGTLPRMRYDLLMNLTWKCFLPLSLGVITIMPAFMYLI